MTTLTLPNAPADGSLSRYLQDIWQYPILEADEEYQLAQRWRDEGDTEAAHKLVTSHLRLVAKIAAKYKGYGLPLADLISEGNIGLMKAVKKFEPERGFRLSTYAMWWIKASITEYILKSWSMVKLGTVASQKKLFFSLRRIKNQLDIVDTGELTDEQLAQVSEATSVSTDDVRNMNRRMAARDMSLNVTVTEDESVEFQDTLVDERPSPEALLGDNQELSARQALLRDALSSLPEREREIFVERRLSDEPKTLEELGQVYGVSRERVRQLEARAFDKVQKAVVAAAQNDSPDMLAAA